MYNKLVTFDDVLIVPKFSTLKSRAEVDLTSTLSASDLSVTLKLPIFSANMDTITGPEMCVALAKKGAMGVLHRFMSIEDNIATFNKVINQGHTCAVSVGLGEQELLRATKLYEVGAHTFFLDVAHGAQLAVVEQYRKLKETLKDIFLVVGNFAGPQSIIDFETHLGFVPDCYKIGIGPGSACTTRLKTGCGVPQVTAILACSKATTAPVIADGGMRYPGDIAKALGCGARAVMLGGMLAGTEETPGKAVQVVHPDYNLVKQYRGSASKESYQDQGKNQDYICAEGESFTVVYKGPVDKILDDISGGLRSAFTYVGAFDLEDFKMKVELVEISSNAAIEAQAHGKC